VHRSWQTRTALLA